jgi:nicotinic acid mononucleotide adenylyltransferase
VFEIGGADYIAKLNLNKHLQRNIICITRESYDVPNSKNIIVIHSSSHNISSTQIRQLIKECKYDEIVKAKLTNEIVVSYIRTNKLFVTNDNS